MQRALLTDETAPGVNSLGIYGLGYDQDGGSYYDYGQGIAEIKESILHQIIRIQPRLTREIRRIVRHKDEAHFYDVMIMYVAFLMRTQGLFFPRQHADLMYVWRRL
jgi:hypothetical protein